ncbi:hypothetical protein VBZ91_001692 [Campylobacter coli]|nr:hypothetical protein [Campylobacter coli]EMA9325986.1 hypothetical protein [Campylobacter coli]EMC1425317.1 hypothetical protein [Campylobacter coli]HEF1579490.1 hypothetical protein [Campylobacter coli]
MAKKRKITLPRIEDINITPDTSCLHPILEDNTLLCIHGGKVNLKAKNAKRIKSDNIPIMLNNEIQGASISGCVNPPILGGPCTKVALVFAYTYSNHKVNHKHSVLQMGLIGVSNKGYPILAIPKKNKIKFALAKIKANPLAKIKWDKIKWEGIGGKRSKKNKNDIARQIQALKNNQQRQKDINKENLDIIKDTAKEKFNLLESANQTNSIQNKLNHIFNKKEHNLDDFLKSFDNSKEKAYEAVVKKIEKNYASGKVSENFTQGYIININGFNIEVRGVIKNGEAKIGTMFLSRTFN